MKLCFLSISTHVYQSQWDRQTCYLVLYLHQIFAEIFEECVIKVLKIVWLWNLTCVTCYANIIRWHLNVHFLSCQSIEECMLSHSICV